MGGDGGASVSELFFLKNPNLKYKNNIFWGEERGGGWGGARVSNFFLLGRGGGRGG